MNEQIRQYFKEHWIAMALSVASSGIVFIISLITIFTNFRLDYATLKGSVEANTTSNTAVVATLGQVTQKLSQIDQKVSDDHEQIQQIDNNIIDIHRFIFAK